METGVLDERVLRRKSRRRQDGLREHHVCGWKRIPPKHVRRMTKREEETQESGAHEQKGKVVAIGILCH